MSHSLELIDSELMTPSLNSGNGQHETEEEELTADEVLQRLQDAWVNEKFAPELLDPQIEIIDCLMEQISRTEEHLATLDKGNFAIALHKMELQRIRFLVRDSTYSLSCFLYYAFKYFVLISPSPEQLLATS